MKKTEITTFLDKSDVDGSQIQSGKEHELRTLTDQEILNVAGGPECDVGTGTG
ncbi:hypothetical protein ACO0K9_08895 [Undibacterium sp. Ji50W]|uniref:hypothetical protein n=1 Tax=Undibacterium sp. Ji50W TaxID=3413041 RepID=UPI003BF0E994